MAHNSEHTVAENTVENADDASLHARAHRWGIHPSQIPHYERVIDICCFLFMFVNMGIASTTFNVFQPYVNALPAMNDSLGSLVVSVRMLASFASTLIVVAYYRVFDCRLGIGLACLSTMLAFLLYSIAESLPMFCIASAFAGFSYGLGGLVGTTLVIGRWFPTNQGMALGIATMGSGLAAIVLPFVATTIIEAAGLAAAFRFEALLALAIGILVYVLLRNHPKESLAFTLHHALHHPRRHFEENFSHASDSARGKSALANSTVLPKGRFRILLAAVFLLGVASLGSNANLAVLLRTNGFDSSFVAAMLTLSGVMLLIAKLVSGGIYDRFGSRAASTLLSCLFTIGLALVCFVVTGSPIVAAIGVAFIYSGQTVSSVGMSKWSLDFASPGQRANTAQTFQMMYTLGTFFGTLFPGFVYDFSGTYVIPYAVFAIAAAICGIIVFQTYSSARKR